ncbi:MAG: hypothetical protein MJY87_08175 [Fibrobacter sp.]|nr:hypothetical protein [Fibrobacter sp.]
MSSSIDEQNFSSSSVESSSSSEEQSSSSIAPKICGPDPASLNLEEVFENQKKALFPDTCEYVMNIHVNSGGLISMDLRTSVLTAGPTKSVMTTRSSLTNTQTVRNDGRVKVTDMRTGNRLPSSDAETNLADFTPLIGTAADYSGAVLEDSLWKLIPIDEKTPTLYYSTCEERVMKIFYVSGDSSTTNTYTYTDEFAGMSGVLKTMHLDRSVYLRDASSRELFKSDSIKVLIDLEVLVAKKRSALPSALFDVTR